MLGSDRSITMLRSALRTQNLAHAYLFVGPPGVGKHTMALAFAMALNCEADPPAGQDCPDVPCGICASCSRIARGTHPDIVEVNLETQALALGESTGRSKTGPAKELRIDVIRDMQSTVGLKPHSARVKVYIIGDAERLNEEASNCLLKTLEEPPAHTILILLAPDVSTVLPTISSRCFVVPVRPVARQALATALQAHWGAEPEQAEVAAALSDGRAGYAVGLLDERDRLQRRRKALEELSLLAGAPVAERVNVATRLAKMFTDARAELYDMLDTWESWWRDVMLLASSASELVINVDQVAALKSVAAKNSPSRAAGAIELIHRTRQQLLENVNPRLALEALALGLP
jgi:DNA polymerase-3 subunit delta'